MPSTTFTTSITRSSSRGVALPSSSFFQPSLILKPKPVERTSSAVFAGLDVDRIPDIGQVPRSSYKRAYSPFPYFIDDRSSAGTKSFRSGTERRGTRTPDSSMALEDASSLGRWEEDADRFFAPGDEFINPSLEMLVQDYGPAAPGGVERDNEEVFDNSDTECSRHSKRNNYEFRVKHQTTRKSPAPMHNTRIDGLVQDRREVPVQDRHIVNSPVNLSKVQHQTPREYAAPMHNIRTDGSLQKGSDDVVQDLHAVTSPVNLSNVPHHTSPNHGRLPRAAKSRALTARELLAGKTNRPGLMTDAVIYCSAGNRRASVKAASKVRSSCPSEAPLAQSRTKKVTRERNPKTSINNANQYIPNEKRLPPPRQPDAEHSMRTRSTWRCPHDHCHYKTGIPKDADAHYATHAETRGSSSRSRSSARSAAYY